MNYNILIVGGDFDDKNGRKSNYIEKFYGWFLSHSLYYNTLKSEIKINYINGGNINELQKIDVKSLDILLWFPNISNDIKNKYLNEFKEINNKLILVQSKFNNGRYTTLDLIARMLKSKSNLLIEFNKDENNITSSIIDPLGNQYYQGDDIKELTYYLTKRLYFIVSLQRVSTRSISKESLVIPNNIDFFNIVEDYGKTFHTLIHAINQSRYLGNCSFRCEKGFSSFRQDKIVYMSKRNLDKRNINQDSFVPVLVKPSKKVINFYGEHKPSVDTPIQIRLYDKLKNIHYMIHSHVYIENAPFTKEKIPCGAIEEVDEILDTITENGLSFSESFYAINLIGHGSIIMANNIEALKDLKYITRPILEN